MHIVELASVILALLMEVLVGVILAQPLKAISREKTAQLGSYGVMTTRKLYYLAKPTHSGVSASAERLRDADEKARGQRPRDAEAGNQRPADAEAGGLKAGGQRDQVQSLNQEILGYEVKT